MDAKRIYYFDFIRVYLVMLVFYHHSAISFGASGGWYYISERVDRVAQALLSVSMGIDQSYFMSLFFFISAYLLPASFDRKGLKAFVKDRVLRLGVPLALFYFVLHPLLVLWIRGTWGKPGLGPMWFVFTLLIFESVYAAYRYLSKRQLVIRLTKRLWVMAVVFILFTGIVAFVIRLWMPIGSSVFGLQLGYFTLYTAMYFLGIVAYRKKLLDRLDMHSGYRWLALIVFIMIPSLIYFGITTPGFQKDLNGGWNGSALYYAVWESIMCVGICYFLLSFGKSYLNRPSTTVQRLSRNSYSFYIVHPFAIVGCVFVAEMIPITPLARLALVCIIGIPLCFALAAAFRQLLRHLGIRI